jgi:hypothetical protein
VQTPSRARGGAGAGAGGLFSPTKAGPPLLSLTPTDLPWNHLTNAHVLHMQRPSTSGPYRGVQPWLGPAASLALRGELHRAASHCCRAAHAPVPRLYAAVFACLQRLKAHPITTSLSKKHTDEFVSFRYE